VTRWAALGTRQGELMGVQPSGNQVTVRSISIDRFSGGKFVETRNNYDTLDMVQQIGVIPSM
jgi:predicted ester cyclase